MSKNNFPHRSLLRFPHKLHWAVGLAALAFAGGGESKEAGTEPSRAPRAAHAVDAPSKPTATTQPKLNDTADSIVVSSSCIGPIALGASKEAVETLSLRVHPKYSGMTHPYSVQYKDGAVTGVQVSLSAATRPVVVAGISLPAKAPLDRVAAALGTCGKPIVQIGGTFHECADGVVLSIGSGSPDEVWVRISYDES